DGYVHARAARDHRPQRGHRAQGQVVTAGRDLIRALAGDRDPVPGGAGRRDLVEQRDSVEDSHQVVIAVSARRAHRELQVDLGGYPDGYGVFRALTGHDGESVPGPCAAASRANSATPSDSPRAWGSIPAARSSSSARGAEPAQPASAARSVLRRWPNAASMTAKTSARDAVVTGGSC